MPSSKQNPRDKQTGQTGKVKNDTNKMGEQNPTQPQRPRGACGRQQPVAGAARQDHRALSRRVARQSPFGLGL